MTPTMFAFSSSRCSAGVQYSEIDWPPDLLHVVLVEEGRSCAEAGHVASTTRLHVPVAGAVDRERQGCWMATFSRPA